MTKNNYLKKCILIILKIALALCLFSALTMLFMPKYIEENIDGRITPEYYREKVPVDVVFTGSSLIQAGVSPMVLYREKGITAYNRSNSSQTIALSYFNAEDVIKRNKPQLIVADVGFMYEASDFVDEGSSRKSLDGMKWSSSKINAIKALMGEEEHFIDYVFPILRFHSRWNDLSLEDLKYWFYKPTVTANGQLIQFNKSQEFTDFNPYKLDEGQAICEENLEYLQKIVDLCNANDVQIMLMKMPSVVSNWNMTMDNQIIELATRNNVIYKNFNDDFESFQFDYIDEFYDVQHLNSIGAEKFSIALADFISNNYNITDRSNDSTVKTEYNKKLEAYEKDMNEKVKLN